MSLLRSAGAVSAAVAVSRLTGVVREMAMARLFGAGAAYDAFLLGFRIPNLARDLLGEGALSAAFVPIFSEYLSHRGRRAARELSNNVATAVLLASAAICVAGTIFAPDLVGLLAPGFADVPGKFDLAVLLTRIMFPFLALVAVAAQAMGILNACDRFGVPALASALFNVGSVTAGLALGFTVGRRYGHGMIVSMAAGVVVGGVLQLLWLVPSLLRAGFSYRPRLDLTDPGLRRVGALMLPALLGGAALQINVMVNTNLASGLVDAAGHVIDGPVSWLGYAFRFMQLPLGLFAAAIASATLPSISRSAARRDSAAFRETLAGSLRLALLLTVPSSVGLAVLGRSMIAAIYQGGRFGPYDTGQTAAALAAYSVGLAGYAAIKILTPAFYALGDAHTPMLVSVASIGVNLAAALALVKVAGLGHVGLALSVSLVALTGGAALFALLARRAGGLDGARTVRTAARIAGASLVMGIACRASNLALGAALGDGRMANLANVALSVLLGVCVFYASGRALRIGELEAVRRACYTFFRNALRPEAGNPPPGDR